jgi:hypothetical protein
MMSRLEPRTSCILSCMLYHYATSVNFLVIGMDSTRYIINRKDICNILAGVGRPGRVPRRPPARSGHDVTGLDINLFPGSPGKMRSSTELGSCHMAQDRRLTEKQVTVPGTDWRSVTPSRPGYNPARPGGGQRFTSTVHQYLRT